MIVSGELPCSKEEAVTLAGIQLHIQKAWPEEDDDDDDDLHSSRSTTDRLRADDDDDVRGAKKKILLLLSCAFNLKCVVVYGYSVVWTYCIQYPVPPAHSIET